MTDARAFPPTVLVVDDEGVRTPLAFAGVVAVRASPILHGINHDRLARYDDGRRRAEELRRDPSSLEDAIAALQEAQKAWDTFEVRQQLAEYTLALQDRRDRLGVADAG